MSGAVTTLLAGNNTDPTVSDGVHSTWQTSTYVIAIEGLDTLLTTGDSAKAVTAWSGTDWSSATSGVFVDLELEQAIHPWEPFANEGGTLTLTIPDDDIGVTMHRTAGGAETELTASADRSDTTFSVKDTGAFGNSGEVHCGTECIGYASKTSTTFAGLTRGKYSPFGRSVNSPRFAHHHRVGHVDYGPALAPKVTQYPREWAGRWIGVWRHGHQSDGTLQLKADATLVFAGRIVEVRDDPATLSTIVMAEHVLTFIKEATIGRDMFTGTIADGVYLAAGQQFTMRDNDGSTTKDANALTVVASGAAGTNQANAGIYTAADLFTVLNAWLAAEYAATRISGIYSLGQATTNNTPDSVRSKIYWRIPGSGAGLFLLTMPKSVAVWLGFSGDPPINAVGYYTVTDSDSTDEDHHKVSDHIPLRTWISFGSYETRVTMETSSGVPADQFDSIPKSMAPILDLGLSWGLFLIDDVVLVRAAFVANGDTYDLRYMWPANPWWGVLDHKDELDSLNKRFDDPTPIKVRQIFIFEMPAGDFVNSLMYGSGGDGYNHPEFDYLPYGSGLGIPGELLGERWETSIDYMPGNTLSIAPALDKPTQVSKLIGSDLVLRHAFLVWKNGGLRMHTWQTPSTTLAIATLTEANKAEPAGHKADHRTSTMLSDRWAHNIIKIRFDREISTDNGGGGEYLSTINIEDRTAIDSAGDRGDVFTIDARNAFTEFVETGAGIRQIVDSTFIPNIGMFTKPLRTFTRSISADYYDSLAPGDIVKVVDSFARDPVTGQRSLSNYPAVIIRHQHSPGGMMPGQDTPEPMVGEVELALLQVDRIYAYSPSAMLDSSASGGGYDSGTLTLTVREHEYSEASESTDITHWSAGDAIRIIEVDPDDPASPLTWTRSISSISGNTIVHDGVALASFDSTKLYRIIPDTYSVCSETQQAKAFQADDVDGFIEDEAQANLFGITTSTVVAGASSHTDLPERHADVTYGDGKPYDVGATVGLARMIDSLIDHKTAISCPILLSTAASNTTNTTGYRLVMMTPIFLTTALLNNSIVRYVKVAPWLASTDGTATSVRITLCAFPPTDATRDDMVRPTPYSENTWSTSSTTWATGTPVVLTLNIKGPSGMAWLLVECAYKATTRGVASFVEQERVIF